MFSLKMSHIVQRKNNSQRIKKKKTPMILFLLSHMAVMFSSVLFLLGFFPRVFCLTWKKHIFAIYSLRDLHTLDEK